MQYGKTNFPFLSFQIHRKFTYHIQNLNSRLLTWVFRTSIFFGIAAWRLGLKLRSIVTIVRLHLIRHLLRQILLCNDFVFFFLLALRPG